MAGVGLAPCRPMGAKDVGDLQLIDERGLSPVGFLARLSGIAVSLLIALLRAMFVEAQVVRGGKARSDIFPRLGIDPRAEPFSSMLCRRST